MGLLECLFWVWKKSCFILSSVPRLFRNRKDTNFESIVWNWRNRNSDIPDFFFILLSKKNIYRSIHKLIRYELFKHQSLRFPIFLAYVVWYLCATSYRAITKMKHTNVSILFINDKILKAGNFSLLIQTNYKLCKFSSQ